MVRIEPPSLLVSVTGRKYHYIPAFIALQRAAPQSETSYLSQAYGFFGCRILVRHRINVFLLLLFCFQATVQELKVPYINIAHENWCSQQLTPRFWRFCQSSMRLFAVVLIVLTKFHLDTSLKPYTYRKLSSLWAVLS